MEKNEKLQLTEKNGKLSGGFMPLSSEKMMKIKGGGVKSNNTGTCTNTSSCSGTNSKTCTNYTYQCGGTTNSGKCIGA